MAAIQMLNELKKLKTQHSSHKSQLNNAVLQPSIEQQKVMIVKSLSQKLVSMAVKRESTKFIFDQRMRIEEELRRKAEEDSSIESGGDVLGRGLDSPPPRRLATAPSKRSLSMGGSSDRKVVSLANVGRMRSDLGRSRRPMTTMSASLRSVAGKVEDFVKSIKTTTNPEDFHAELEDQLMHRAKDATKVFEIICKSMKMGAVCIFNPRHTHEEIDLSQYSAAGHSLEKVTKLEDLATFRKKDGMLLYMDPATNTYGHQVTLRITYLKAVDIGEEHLVTKEYAFWSDGNYYGMRIMRDNRANTGLHALLHDDDHSEESRSSLPGWAGRAPWYVPAPICKLSIVGLEDYAQAASLAYNLSKLKLFAISCANPKAGLKRLQEFLDQQLLIEMANITVTGGMTAMHLAALHGNLDAIQTLVTTGANINYRCKGDKHLTALHEAVIGGHVPVVRYLLSQGASQIVTDDLGRCPLHYSCQLGHVTITRLLMDGTGGRRALLIEDKNGQKPYDLCATNFLKNRVEGKRLRSHPLSLCRSIYNYCVYFSS